MQQILSWISKKLPNKCNSMSLRSFQGVQKCDTGLKWVNHASFSFEYLNKDTATSVRRNIKRLTALAKKHHRPAFNESDLCDFLGISPEAANKVNKNNSQDFVSSLYQYFTRKITTNGLIVWRVRSTSVQVTLFNNYDLETGDFKVDLPSINA